MSELQSRRVADEAWGPFIRISLNGKSFEWHEIFYLFIFTGFVADTRETSWLFQPISPDLKLIVFWLILPNCPPEPPPRLASLPATICLMKKLRIASYTKQSLSHSGIQPSLPPFYGTWKSCMYKQCRGPSYAIKQNGGDEMWLGMRQDCILPL